MLAACAASRLSVPDGSFSRVKSRSVDSPNTVGPGQIAERPKSADVRVSDDVLDLIWAQLAGKLVYRGPFPEPNVDRILKQALLNASSINRQWRAAALPYIFKSFDLAVSNPNDLEYFLRVFNDSMPWVRSLHVHLHPFGAAVHRSIATSLADLFPNLVWMHVSFFAGRDGTRSAMTKEEAFGCFRSTLEQMQELQYLSIGGKMFRSDTMGRSEHVSEGEVAHLVPSSFSGHLQLRSPATVLLPSNLHGLDLRNPRYNDIYTMLHDRSYVSLRKLSIRDLDSCNGRTFQRAEIVDLLRASCPNVTELYDTSMRDWGLNFLPAAFPKLEKLICRSSQFQFRTWTGWVPQPIPTTLKHFHLVTIDRAFLEILAGAVLSNLETLVIYNERLTEGCKEKDIKDMRKAVNALTRVCAREGVKFWQGRMCELHGLVPIAVDSKTGAHIITCKHRRHAEYLSEVFEIFERGTIPDGPSMIQHSETIGRVGYSNE